MDTKIRTLQLLEQSALMKQAVTVEPDILNILVTIGSEIPPERWTRWDAYSELKRQCDRYIGWNARKQEIATSMHWNAFIAFIDTLLPDSDEYYGNMEEEEDCYVDKTGRTTVAIERIGTFLARVASEKSA